MKKTKDGTDLTLFRFSLPYDMWYDIIFKIADSYT